MPVLVLLDACVLLPYQLCDLVLRPAEADMYRPLWSADILDEVERNLVDSFGKTPHQAHRRVQQMQTAFPDAAVEDYADLIAVMTTHPKDRHVAAAAVRGCAAVIVTANLKDFPPPALDRYGIDVLHPDRFLQDQLDLDPQRTLTCLLEQRTAYTKPHLTTTEFYRTLRVTVPKFAQLAEALDHREALAVAPVLPVEIVDDDAALEAFFPDGDPDPTTPRGVAYLWWTALLGLPEYRTALERLSWNPAVWGDYSGIVDLLDGWDMMQNATYSDDAPDKLAYVRFMRSTGRSVRAFDDFPLDDVQILTVVHCADGWWRVWGISSNYQPTAQDVFTEPASG